MTAKELKRIFQKGECLSLDTLRLYNDGKLNKKSMHEVEKHLLECGLCAGAVDGLNPKRIKEVNKLSEHIQRRLAVYMNTPPRVPFFRRFGFAIVTFFIVAIGSCSWWYFSKDKKNTSTKPADSVVATIAGNQNTNDNLNSSTPPPFQDQNTSTAVSDNQGNSNGNVANAPSKMQNLPADLPGQPNTLTVDQNQPSTTLTDPNASSNDLGGANSRVANINQPLRIKSVLVYPPVTLDDKTKRKESKDGQLGRTTGSDASFQQDQMPFYTGGDVALQNYFMSNFKPSTADRDKLKRYATGISFVVNSKTGKISSPDISFSISPDVDAELLRVISTMPDWNPGKKRGDVQIMLGITFE